MYAVETVRMLLDRGLLVRSGDRFELTGPVDTLDVPESLQSLIAARFDGLPPEERDAASGRRGARARRSRRPAIAASDGPAGRTSSTKILDSLVRKELLSVQRDPLATRPRPIRVPAIARAEDRVRHARRRRTARPGTSPSPSNLERTWIGRRGRDRRGARLPLRRGVSARRPTADDARAIRAKACETLTRAGERAPSPRRAARGAHLLPARRRARPSTDLRARGAEGARGLHGRHQRARR